MMTSTQNTSHTTAARRVRGAGRDWAKLRDFRGFEFGKNFVMKYLGMKAEGGKSSKKIRVYSCLGLGERAPSPSPSVTATCKLLVKVCKDDGCVYTDGFCTCSENNKGKILPFGGGPEVADVAALGLEYPLGYLDRCHEPLPSPGRKTPKSLKRQKADVAGTAKTATVTTTATTTTTSKKGRKCIDPAKPGSPVLVSAFDGPSSVFFRSHRVLPKTPVSVTVAAAAEANVPMPKPLFLEEEVGRPTPFRGGASIFVHDEHSMRFLYDNVHGGGNDGSTGMNENMYPIHTPRSYVEDEASRESAVSAATTVDCFTPDELYRYIDVDDKDFVPLSEVPLTSSDFDDVYYGESRPESSLGFNGMSLSSSIRDGQPADDSDMDSMSLSSSDSSDMVFSDKTLNGGQRDGVRVEAVFVGAPANGGEVIGHVDIAPRLGAHATMLEEHSAFQDCIFHQGIKRITAPDTSLQCFRAV